MPTRSMTSATYLGDSTFYARVWSAARRTCVRIAQYLAQCRESYTAAVLYQELSKLSDAELERRGIGRCDLHREAFRR
jgi:hypothetical protein